MKKLNKKLNNKGFTLVEVIAVIVLIAVLGMIAVPNVLNIINNSKESTYNILVNDIVIASKQLYEEIVYNKSEIDKYNSAGFSNEKVSINNSTKEIIINLQTLVNSGILKGSNNPNASSNNGKKKIVTNPKTNKDIGGCTIIIKKIVDSNYNTSYEVKADAGSGTDCPTTADYESVK